MGRYTVDIIFGGDSICVETDDPSVIVQEMFRHQDFGCLIQMGREYEDDEGQKELDKLEAFLKKYREGALTMEDIKSLDIRLGAGNILCSKMVDNEDSGKAD